MKLERFAGFMNGASNSNVYPFLDFRVLFEYIELLHISNSYSDFNGCKSRFMTGHRLQQGFSQLFFPKAGADDQFEIEIPDLASKCFVAPVFAKAGNDDQLQVFTDRLYEV